MASMENLWPQFEAKKVISPKTLMLEQANYLAESTNNVIIGEVTSTKHPARDERLIHHFKIIAPAMNNFKYTLFYIVHEVIFYPLTFYFKNAEMKVLDEFSFKEVMKTAFRDEDTVRIISSLYSQSIE